MQITTTDFPIKSFTVASGSTITADTLVTLDSSGLLIPATAGSVIGVAKSALQGGAVWSVQLLNRTVRLVQDSAIAFGADVQQKSSVPTRVETASSGVRIGKKIAPVTTGAQNDVIEVVLQGGGFQANGLTLTTETGVLHGNADGEISAVALATETSTDGTAAAASASLANLAAEAEKIGDDTRDVRAKFATLVTKTEELADDVRSLRAAVIAAGVPITLA